MSAIKFIVEGNADALFIRAFLKKHLNLDYKDNDFIKIGGCTKELLSLDANLKLINESISKGRKNLLLFDADQPDFKQTKGNLELWKKELEIDYKIFLFPNNKDDGSLETLLFNIANLTDGKDGVLNCFDSYKQCITGLNKNFSLPDAHAKFYAFEEAVLSRTKFKDVGNKPDKYLLDELYNIKSDYLNPLKEFLTTHL